jgi:hypothetical protein
VVFVAAAAAAAAAASRPVHLLDRISEGTQQTAHSRLLLPSGAGEDNGMDHNQELTD